MALTKKQKAKLLTDLKKYRSKYLNKRNLDLDESATRIMVNSFLSEVLGFIELEEIKTEYAIKGTYADYVLQSKRKKHLVVEVKAISINLSDSHIRQAVNYGANEGIDWVLLTNGRQWQLYRVIFGKPIKTKLIFDFDLVDLKALKDSLDYFEILTKSCVEKGDLDEFWHRFQALDPSHLAQFVLTGETIKKLKRELKKSTKLSFSEEDILNSLHEMVVTKIEVAKPTMRKLFPEKKANKIKKDNPDLAISDSNDSLTQ